MTHLTGNDRTKYVQNMFGRIAHRYDLLNRLMTFGQDVSWRKELIEKLNIQPNETVLDLGAGTGDLALEIKKRHPDTFVVASDLTPEMVLVGKERPGGDQISWVISDAQNLPFKKESAGVVVSGYLLRNVPDVPRTLSEQHRVLGSGGRVASLDTTPPRDNWMRPFLEFHMHRVIPFLGSLIAGDSEAYTYLPDSTEQFLTAENLAEAFTAAGFSAVTFARRMFGTMGLHWGEKEINLKQ